MDGTCGAGVLAQGGEADVGLAAAGAPLVFVEVGAEEAGDVLAGLGDAAAEEDELAAMAKELAEVATDSEVTVTYSSRPVKIRSSSTSGAEAAGEESGSPVDGAAKVTKDGLAVTRGEEETMYAFAQIATWTEESGSGLLRIQLLGGGVEDALVIDAGGGAQQLAKELAVVSAAAKAQAEKTTE